MDEDWLGEQAVWIDGTSGTLVVDLPLFCATDTQVADGLIEERQSKR